MGDSETVVAQTSTVTGYSSAAYTSTGNSDNNPNAASEAPAYAAYAVPDGNAYNIDSNSVEQDVHAHMEYQSKQGVRTDGDATHVAAYEHGLTEASHAASYDSSVNGTIMNHKSIFVAVKQQKENKINMGEGKNRNSKVEEESQQEEQQLSTTNKRKRKVVFPYGNYKSYYGYRIGQGIEEDPRLKVFRKEWFEGKDCLDIGCNSGVVTVQIDLIQDAKWHLKQIMRKESAGENGKSACKSKVLKKTNCSEFGENPYSSEGTSEVMGDSSPPNKRLSDIVFFRTEDFIHPEINERKEKPKYFLQNRCVAKKYYDIILCLSVAKWIHLNWGDDGLIALFSRVWELLHWGGIFVFEPQPWQSYQSNRLVTETTAKNFRDIKFRPDEFTEILLDKIGFRKVEDINSGLSGGKTGFNRPIFVFHK